MEEDRTAFSDETSKKLRKQRKLIDILRKEKQKLTTDINVATCSNQKRRDKKYTREIYKLLDNYEKYCEFVDNEMVNINELNVQIRKIENNLHEVKPKKMVSENEYLFRVNSGKKSVMALQNKLDNINKRFCGILTDNNRLRIEIDHLLKERCRYNALWEKLLKEIKDGKKYMVELIEQATLAFDQREEWCSKLEALKRRSQQDFLSHTEDMREMQRSLDHFCKLKEFLSVKGQKRILRDLEEKEKLKENEEQKNLENQLKIFEETFTKIQSYCNGEEEIEKIASLYIKQEEENFALFNYVNELNHEIEALNGNVLDINEKIDEQMKLCKERAKDRQHTLESLKKDVAEVLEQFKRDEDDLKKVEDNLSSILKGVENIFNLLQCERGPILELLGDNIEVSLFNIMIYLGSIEKKISNYVNEIYYTEKSILSSKRK